jgi:hypothetical protein
MPGPIRKRYWPARIAVTVALIIGALLVTGAVARSLSGTHSVCRTGDRELQGGFAQAAAQTYLQDVSHANADCVHSGLVRSMASLCRLGDNFVRSGSYTNATDAYEHALAAWPRSRCGRVGLRHVAIAKCELSARLTRQHRSQEATKLREQIVTQASVVCAQEGDWATKIHDGTAGPLRPDRG